MLPKKIFKAVIIFALLFLPLITLSFLAHTVYHQIIFFLSAFAAASFAYYVAGLISQEERLSHEIFVQAYELKKSKEALDSCLVMDTQTHIYNERLLASRLTEECARARRYHRPLSFMMIAIDSYDEIRARSGTVVSQVIVHETAQFLKESTRSVDIIIRYGEGRFVAILPETPVHSARVAAERVRYAVEKNTFQIEDKALKFTVSVGLIGFDPAVHRGREDVLKSLEQTFAQAKKGGPNQVAMLSGDLV